MTQEFDPRDLISPEHYGRKGLPHPEWTRLRRESPVHWCEGDEFENFWAITKHADIMDISGTPDHFTNAPGTLIQSRAQIAFEAANPREFNMKTIIEMDPPEHRAIRKVASGFFTPRGIARLDEIVERSARQLIDSLGDAGECDFIDVVAQRHPCACLPPFWVSTSATRRTFFFGRSRSSLPTTPTCNGNRITPSMAPGRRRQTFTNSSIGSFRTDERTRPMTSQA